MRNIFALGDLKFFSPTQRYQDGHYLQKGHSYKWPSLGKCLWPCGPELLLREPIQRHRGRWIELAGGTQLQQAAHSGKPFFLCGLETCLSQSQTLGKLGWGAAQGYHTTSPPRDTQLPSLGKLLLSPQAVPTGTSVNPVALDESSRPNNTTEALEINLPLE